jgi:cytochrome c oxidase assembly protein subunit 15
MASVFHAFPQLRTAAPRLSRRLFVCTPCLNARPPVRSLFAASRSCAPRPSPTQSVRWKSTQPLRSSATVRAPNAEPTILADAVNGERSRAKSYPNVSSKSVAYWLLGSAASVFGIVVFGGLTRLTESG